MGDTESRRGMNVTVGYTARFMTAQSRKSYDFETGERSSGANRAFGFESKRLEAQCFPVPKPTILFRVQTI